MSDERSVDPVQHTLSEALCCRVERLLAEEAGASAALREHDLGGEIVGVRGYLESIAPAELEDDELFDAYWAAASALEGITLPEDLSRTDGSLTRRMLAAEVRRLVQAVETLLKQGVGHPYASKIPLCCCAQMESRGQEESPTPGPAAR